MRILILGGTGMLGHKMVETLGVAHDVWSTVRGVIDGERTVGGVDAMAFATVAGAVRAIEPEVVVNCVGIIKQHPAAKDPLLCHEVNTLLPHRLAAFCSAEGRRLIHISTDCVFDGRKGGYKEGDPTDAEDLYGRSKAMGEIHDAPHVTLRTSIIGREQRGGSSLVEWILAQNGGVAKGFTKALFSGLTTLELSRVVRDLILPWPDLTGLYHVSADPIAKHDLLGLVARAYRLDLRVVPDDALAIDRTLDSTRFRNATGYLPPCWSELVSAMAEDAPLPSSRALVHA